jgi:hypothetical protein
VSAGRGETESPPVALPSWEPPSGIWTVRRGPRARPPLEAGVPAVLKLLERDGGVNVVSGTAERDAVRDLS